ncbi:hypothetical protein PG984_014750 [Apiospora sp. TS-2023a]
MSPQMRKRAPAAQPGGAELPNLASPENATLLLQKAKARVLLLFDELPVWAKGNDLILSGWRPETNSYWECIKSMGYVHNETANIYSHLFAAIWMVVLGSWWAMHAKEQYPATGFDDGFIFFCSSWGEPHSHATHVFCLKLDFLGILVVTAGCFPPGLWYTFPCASRQMKLNWIAVGAPFSDQASSPT